MSWFAFAFTYAGVTAWALAMPSHHRAVFQEELTPRRRLAWRLTSALLLALALTLAIAAQNPPRGSILWLAHLAASGFTLTLLLTFAPRVCALPIVVLLLLGAMN